MILQDLLESEKPAITNANGSVMAKTENYQLEISETDKSIRVVYTDAMVHIDFTHKTEGGGGLIYMVNPGFLPTQIEHLAAIQGGFAEDLTKALRTGRTTVKLPTIDGRDELADLVKRQAEYNKIICTQ